MSTESMSKPAPTGVLSPEWVSVEERLPEPEVWVWVFIDFRTNADTYYWKKFFKNPVTKVLPARINERTGDWYFCYVGGSMITEWYNYVTHWMPQPEGPNVFFEEE